MNNWKQFLFFLVLFFVLLRCQYFLINYVLEIFNIQIMHNHISWIETTILAISGYSSYKATRKISTKFACWQ
ncbi:hypothetical protein CWC45_01735 [Neisseria sp. N177_16]|nr:hypothetical protein CWC45_01735 [Neisseria sp. N177_16]